MTVPEYPLWGAAEIVAFLGWSESKFYRKLHRLLDAGVVWHQWRGKPPRNMLKAYPSMLLHYQIKKSLRGEIL